MNNDNKRRIIFLSIVFLTLTLDLFSKWFVGSIFNHEYPGGCPYPHCSTGILSFGQPCLSAADTVRFEQNPDIYKEIIPNFFYLHLMNNTGAAWSFMSGMNHYFIIFNILFVLGAFYFMLRKNAIPLLLFISYSIIIGGAMGNFYDRLVHNSVRDFLSFLIPLPNGSVYPYPVFNGADIFIFCGAALYLIDQLIMERFRNKNKLAPTLPEVAKENGQ
jgi:signal peptidase II